MIKQRFTCRNEHCSNDILSDYQNIAECCGQPMKRGEYDFPKRTPEDAQQRKLHMITLLVDPEVAWQHPGKPNAIFEIWQLAPGRPNGELIGYIGARETMVEWVMPVGIAIRGGLSNTVEDAVGCMLEALEGGVFSSQRIKSEMA